MFENKFIKITVILIGCIWLISCGLNKNSAASASSTINKAATSLVRMSIVQKMKELDDRPIEERIALYKKLKKEKPDAYNFENEDELTMYGYGFLWSNKTDEALEIFKLIVEQFGSANSYDSLGEAYLKLGQKDLALTLYQKSLAMNPDNYNAEDQIELIKNPDQKPLKLQEKFGKRFNESAYKADIDQLSESILKIHPNALKFISKKDFEALISESKKQVNSETTFGEFSYICNKIIASISCSHTGMGGFYPEHEMLQITDRFPLQSRWIDGRLFVIDPLNNGDKVKVKDEIVSINGIDITSIIKEIYTHIPAQGHVTTTKNHVFNKLSSSMLPYALGFPESYSIVIKGNKDAIRLNKAKSVIEPFWDHNQYCEDQLCIEYLADKKSALMTIASFNYYRWNNLDVFVKFMDKNFRDLKEKGVTNLIIDVRYNGGGSQSSAIHLLRYLVNRPFKYYSKTDFAGKIGLFEGEEIITPFENRYEGKLYFLIDGNGNSTTGHFMSLVKVMKLGTIIGEELGSNQFCSAGSTSCRLKNTKLNYYIANNTHISTATTLSDEKGILPDHFVSQTVEDYLNKRDVVKEFAIKLIN